MLDRRQAEEETDRRLGRSRSGHQIQDEQDFAGNASFRHCEGRNLLQD